MSEKKVYYWMKLKDSFMNSDEVDYLMSQKDGANYVVIYQMIVLSVANSNGKLQTEIGDMIVPYTFEKICRVCKWFSADTIKVALTFFAQLGLMFKDENGVLEISGFNDFVGHETNYAQQKRIQREREKEALPDNENEEKSEVDNEVDNVHSALISLSLNSLSSNNSNKSDNRCNKTKRKSKYEECLEINMNIYNNHINDYSFSEELKKNITEWLDYKSEKHKDSYTDGGMIRFLSEMRNNVAEHGEPAVITVIGKAIMMNWKGIYYDSIKDVVPSAHEEKFESYRSDRE